MVYSRIRDIICHPSRIGLYFRDKIYVVIINFILFFGLTIGILAFDNLYKPNSFDRSLAMTIADEVSINFDPSKESISYKNNKLSGSSELHLSKYTLYLNADVIDDDITTFVLIFKEEKVSGYFKGYKTFDIAYNELNDYEFNFENIVNNVTKDRISFVEFLTPILEEFESSYSVYVFASNVGSILIYYFGLLVALLIFTVMANPEIRFKIRAKLMIYDSLIFFIALIFSILFNASWLLYVGLALSVIYSNITFSHIIKVKIKKV